MMEHDYSASAERVADSFGGCIGFFAHETYLKIAKLCDSPIEAMLGTSVVLLAGVIRATWPTSNPIVTCAQDDMEKILALNDYRVLFVPQFSWKNYRIDWAIHYTRLKPNLIFVECDGHEYHHATKEQIERDKQRDRDIQAAGIPIIRFAGSEIYRDPTDAATKLINFVISRRKLAEGVE